MQIAHLFRAVPKNNHWATHGGKRTVAVSLGIISLCRNSRVGVSPFWLKWWVG